MRLFFVLLLTIFAGAAQANALQPRPGWVVMPTDKPYAQLIKDVIAATRANKMGVVTQAGPTEAARKRGVEIPGNRVIGVFNNRFAVSVLGLSTAAMIVAPIRIYVTEDAGGTATLAYKTPTAVFSPYLDEGGDALAAIAAELDTIFAKIAAEASTPGS